MCKTNTNNVNKALAFLQTTAGKDEPNISLLRKLQPKSQHGTQNVKARIRTTTKDKKMSNIKYSSLQINAIIEITRH